ncbi:MAG: hypothetical protein WC593_15155 [Methanoregula sp.]
MTTCPHFKASQEANTTHDPGDCHFWRYDMYRVLWYCSCVDKPGNDCLSEGKGEKGMEHHIEVERER